jgi:hypothetical protein
MIRSFAVAACALALAAPLALAQTAPVDSTGLPPVQTQATPPPAPVRRPTTSRYGALSGSLLVPGGDFADVVEDGWSITVEGFQFTNPRRKVTVGTELGYYDFGGKKGPLGVDSKVWFVPVDLVLRALPMSDAGRLSPFAQGGIGFNYVRTDVGGATDTDVEFGAQAGFGVLLHGNGSKALKVDAVYHWIFGGGNGTDVEFWSVRGGIVVPMMR